MSRKLIVDSLSVLLATSLLTWSFTSLESMHINVITQSPFFLYDNVAYIASIIISIVAIVIAAYLRKYLFASITLLLTLWSLLLIAPYMVYLKSLPLYNDQLGFVLEALQGILHGYTKPIQGEASSLGHAYFTSVYTLICGFEPLQGVITVQIMLPVLYALPLLAVKHGIFYDKISVALIVLAAMLNPVFYGRTPFAWFYLVLLTFHLYNTVLGTEVRGLSISMVIALALIYVAYVISDPTSLIVPIALSIATLFNRRLIPLTISTVVTWFSVNLVMYLSGSFYSTMVQLMALIESPVNPLPSLIAPPVNPTIKLYNYFRMLTMSLNFLIGLISAVIITSRTKKGVGGENKLSWAILYLVLVVLQAMALAMNRWGMVPYSMYVLTVLPILVLLGLENKLLKATILLVAIPLLALSPIVKWGFSPIAFPTLYDLDEVRYLVSYTAQQATICASGAHVMAEFYYKLYNVSAQLITLDPLPHLKPFQILRCNYIAVFYKSFNIYRLGISENQLKSIIAEFDHNYSVIYRNRMWTIWLR